MVDWLTVETPDPVGIPVNSGRVMRISREGLIEWMTPARLSVEGSHSSNMTFRALGAEYTDNDNPALVGLRDNVRQSGLEVSGNPSKFLQGHNLFGSADLKELLVATINKGRSAIWPDLLDEPAIDVAEGLISRVDLTGSWLLEQQADVLPVLQALEASVWCPYRGRGVFDAGGSTLYYGHVRSGKRAKDWALKLYWKGPEISAHPLPRPAYDVPGMLDELNRTIRVELTLRTPELRRLNLRKVGQWTPAIVRQTWEAYVGKLKIPKALVNFDAVDLSRVGLKPRHIHALAAWRAGNDLRVGMSKASFYRLRNELLDETSFDIATRYREKSNVVPFRRHVELVAAPYPQWADALTAALAAEDAA